MLDDLKPHEQIVWACAFAQSCNHVFADMVVERYRDEMHRRSIEATAPKSAETNEPRALLERIGYLPRRPRPESEDDT